MKQICKIFLVVALTALLAAPAMAEQKVRWKMATTWSSTLTPLISPPRQLAKWVEVMSGGNFTIRIDGAEKHKAALGILDMVKGGQYDIGHSAAYYWKGKDISSVFFTSVPFGMNVGEQHAWYMYGGGKELEKELFDKYGVLSFRGGNTGIQMGGWFKKEIKTVDDLKGLKMRIPGLAGEVFAKLGVNVTNIPPGELYTSLDRGTIDALEWVGPAMDIKMGFHKIAPYYYTGWHEPASEMQYLVNQRKYDRLSDENKAILEAAIRLTAYDMYVENFAMSVKAWAEMQAEFPNIKVMEFPVPVLKAMKQAADDIYDEYAAKDPMFKKVLDSQRAYMEMAREWTAISEYNYIKISEAIK